MTEPCGPSPEYWPKKYSPFTVCLSLGCQSILPRTLSRGEWPVGWARNFWLGPLWKRPGLLGSAAQCGLFPAAYVKPAIFRLRSLGAVVIALHASSKLL